jgi:hypothetical protein
MMTANLSARIASAALLLCLSAYAGAREARLQSSSDSSTSAPQKPGSNQPAGPTSSPQTQENARPANQPDSEKPRETKVDILVKDAYLFGYEDPADSERSSAAIDDIIVVTVQGLQSLVNQSRCLDETDNRVPNCVEHPITLFLDSREIKGVTPEAIDLLAESLHFHLQRTDENNEAWSDLLGAARSTLSFSNVRPRLAWVCRMSLRSSQRSEASSSSA